MPHRLSKWLTGISVVFIGFVIWFAWHSTTRVVVKSYSLTGTVVAVHPETAMVNLHNDNMPGFMQPMNMEYVVKDPKVLSSLKPGDAVQATLLSDGRNVWELQNVVVTQHH